MNQEKQTEKFYDLSVSHHPSQLFNTVLVVNVELGWKSFEN